MKCQISHLMFSSVVVIRIAVRNSDGILRTMKCQTSHVMFPSIVVILIAATKLSEHQENKEKDESNRYVAGDTSDDLTEDNRRSLIENVIERGQQNVLQFTDRLCLLICCSYICAFNCLLSGRYRGQSVMVIVEG